MGTPLAIAVQRIGGGAFPTPMAADGGLSRGRPGGGGGGGFGLRDAVRSLPTPAARDTKGPGRPVGRVRPDGRVRGDEDLTLPDVAERFGAPGSRIATPRASDGDKGGPGQRGSSGDLMLPAQVDQLLPTPRASPNENRTSGRTPSQDRGAHGRYLSAEVLTLFPTPTKTNANGNGENNRGEKLLPGVAEALMPTPLATNTTGGLPLPATRTHDGPDHGPRLQDIAITLLPTTTASDAGASRSATSPRHLDGPGKVGYTLTDRVAPPGQDKFPGWGPYAGAVARWEAITGRPAPVPVQPSAPTKRRIRDCAHATGMDGYAAKAAIEAGLWGAQLAPPFSEWLMGMPAGRVTAVPGLTRNQKLRLIGNGVVTLQAAAGIGVLAAELGWTG